MKQANFQSALRAGAAAAVLALSLGVAAQPRPFNIPAGELKASLEAYALQAGVQLVYRLEDLRGLGSKGLQGTATAEEALDALLAGTQLKVRRDPSNAIVIFKAADAADPQPASGGLEVVTVTAQKRPEAAQSVPISMTTLSAQALETHRIESLKDVSRLTPGLLVSSFSLANPTLAIRGTNNTFSQIGVSKPVSVVIDDVFIARNSAAHFDLFDLESIAVLKGPQGTLFGRNVTGGAIVLATRKPSLAESRFEGRLTAGNLDERKVAAFASVPVSEAAAFKLSASLHTRDGYGHDRLTGRAQDDVDSRNLRGQFRIVANDDLEVLLGADYSRDESGGRTLSSTTLGDDGQRRTSELGVAQSFGRSIWGTSARLSWTMAAGEITSVTAYRKSEADERYSGVGASYTLLTSGSQSVVGDADQVGTFTHETRFASAGKPWGHWVAGLFVLKEKGTRQLDTRGLLARTGAVSTSTLSDQRVETSSYGVFADGTWRALPTVELMGGLRYTFDEKTASLVRTDRLRAENSFAASGLKHSWEQLTPRLAVNWKPSPALMGYASVTRGFTAGGFNADAASLRAFVLPFDPETVTNHELGLKSQWLENRLRFNLSLFRMKYKDKQEFVNNTTTGILSIVNASAATIKGAEMELAWRPARWLQLALNYANLDARYDSFVVGNINNTGNPLSSSPRNTWSFVTDLSYPVSWGKLLAALSYSRIDPYNTGAANDPNLKIPGYGLVNLSAGAELAGGRARVSAWVDNAADTPYILTRSTQVVRAEYLGPPRRCGIAFSAKY